MMISFDRDGGNPWVWHKYASSGALNTYIQLNAAGGVFTTPSSGYFTAMSASTLTMTAGSTSIYNLNRNAHPYLLYAFHSVEGYSKVGTYTGNGQADGTFIYTGFKPAFLLVRLKTGDDWTMMDDERSPYNQVQKSVVANQTLAEVNLTAKGMDFLSNGVKMRNADNGINISNGSFLYIAFAESPFKTSNAR
jgi:hypothetical protein